MIRATFYRLGAGLMYTMVKLSVTGDAIFQPLTIKLMASDVHRHMFLLAAKLPSGVWDVGVIAAFAAAGLALFTDTHVPGLSPVQQFCIEIALLFWLGLGRSYIPHKKFPSIIAVTENTDTISLHLKGEIPPLGDLHTSLAKVIDMCRLHRIDRVELRSAIFGRPAKEQIWYRRVTLLIGTLDPQAQVVVADREDLSRSASLKYQLGNRSHARHAVARGAVFKAARIQIRNLSRRS